MTALVHLHGPPYQERQPRSRTVTSAKPRPVSWSAYTRAWRKTAIINRPSGRSARAASATAVIRPGSSRMLWKPGHAGLVQVERAGDAQVQLMRYMLASLDE